MNILILGGSSSGKSLYAQRLAKELAVPGKLFYLATMNPCDDEDRARIARHRAERAGWGFQTLEQPRNAGEAARFLDGGSTLLADSVTALLTNESFSPTGEFYPGAGERVFKGISRLMETAGNLVLVSDQLFSDALRYEATTVSFRRELGRLNRRLAARCGRVAEVRCGLARIWKDEGETE